MTLADHYTTTCLIDEFQAPRVMHRLEKKTAVKIIETKVSERVINDKLPVAQLIPGLEEIGSAQRTPGCAQSAPPLTCKFNCLKLPETSLPGPNASMMRSGEKSRTCNLRVS